MIEMSAEIRAWLVREENKIEPEEDEYIDPADGLLHCKKCGGQRQTVVPRFGKPDISCHAVSVPVKSRR